MLKNSKEGVTRRTALLATASASAVGALGTWTGSALAQPLCSGVHHANQIKTLKETMGSAYIERPLKEAMLRSADCPDCGKRLGRYAKSALPIA